MAPDGTPIEFDDFPRQADESRKSKDGMEKQLG